MRTELLMFREMPSMPLDFPGPKHGSTCFHQNPVVFARPGLAMGLKKNENDGPVCRLSQMNREHEKKSDGKKSAPVDMVNLTLFLGIHTSQVVSRISDINSITISFPRTCQVDVT